jgi:aspartate aminotransferase
MVAEYARRRDRIVAGLRAIPGLTCTEPGGAFYAYPSVAAHLGKDVPDTTVLAKQLLERQYVAVVPGDACGTPGYIRISYATTMEQIDKGLQRFQKFFSMAESVR